MAKVDGDDVELTGRDAAIVKGMLERGDNQHHIAAYFGVDSRAISHVKNGKTFTDVGCATVGEVPPPGPYKLDPTYVGFYQRMATVNFLWEQRKLKEAKALLERSLRSPVIPNEQNEIDQIADDLFRDEFGLL